MNPLFLYPPLKTRRQIPFFYDKSEAEFRQDPYENYYEMVMRQSILHLCHNEKTYPHQPILDWILAQLPKATSSKIADIGCGVGRLTGEIAQLYPNSECWGVDYSYQLLRQAHDYWVAGKTLDLDGTSRGFDKLQSTGKTLSNLHFGLAKGEQLPFVDASLDLICSSFTLDRFEDPLLALQEMFRVLKLQGTLLLVSPLNFQQAKHWELLFPISRLLEQLEHIGFSIEKMEENLIVREPLDKNGNHIVWTCLAVVLKLFSKPRTDVSAWKRISR